MQALLALVALLASAQGTPLPIPGPAEEDCYVLDFAENPADQMSLLVFLDYLEEATGLHFIYGPKLEQKLESTKIVIPGTVRVPKSLFAEFARFQLFLRGFGWFESGPPSRMTVRPVSSSLVRVAFPPVEVAFGFDERAHPEPMVPVEPVVGEGAGLVVSRPGSAPGYTLVTGFSSAEAHLIDSRGQVLRRWTDAEGGSRHWDQVLLLRNGDLLCVDPWNQSLLRLGFDGRAVWRLSLGAHHEAAELGDGRILVLTRRFRVIPAFHAERRTVDNLVTIVSSDGRVLEEHSLYDLLQTEPQALSIECPPEIGDLPPGYDVDPIHASSLSCLEKPASQDANPLLRPGRVLVTLRNLDSVALFDLADRRCVWVWGRGFLRSPHDACFLVNGNLLVLEDGSDPRLGSRVIEVNPQTGQVEWEYRAPLPGTFPTSGRGRVQALRNGNVLVASSSRCEAFEITRAGELVWRYVSSGYGAIGTLGVQGVERYEPGFVAPLLAAPSQAPR